MSGGGSKNSPHVYVFRPADSWRLLVVVAIGPVLALAVAACGGSSEPNNSHAGSKSANAFLAFSECMRAHGVTNFPDPSSRGGIALPAGMNPAAPSFRSAQAACRHLMPGGGPGGHRATKRQVAAMVATSECMRQHGVSGFPDPFAAPNGPPTLNPARYSTIQDMGGEVIAIPKSIDVNSPVFKQAAKACKYS